MARMFNALHTSLCDSLFVVLVVIPIAFFLYPENIYALWRITPENDAIIHYQMKVSIVDCNKCFVRYKQFENLTA
jgi:hypothetical protein